MRRLCNFIIKFSLYGLVFLLPLFWLPFSLEPYEFNKQYLLVFLVSLGFLSWLAKMIFIRKKVVWRRTPLDIPILIFGLVMIFSAVYSVDNVSSWLGFYGRFSDSVSGLLAILVFYFVVVNNVSTNNQQQTTNNRLRLIPEEQGGVPALAGDLSLPKGDLSLPKGDLSLPKGRTPDEGRTPVRFSITTKGMLNWFLASVALAVLAAYFSIFNVWAKLPWLAKNLPTAMGLKTFNPIGGNLEGLAVFLAAAVSLVMGMILNYSLSKASGTSGVEGIRPSTRFARSGNNKRARSSDNRGAFGSSPSATRSGDNRGSRSGGIWKLFRFLLLLASIILLVIIDFWPAWLALGGTMLILLAIAFWTRMFKERVNILILPIILIIISAAGLWINIRTDFPEIGLFQLPQEIILDYQTSWTVVFEGFKEQPVLGSGPATFFSDFTKFKPKEFNENIFWNIRFDRAPSYLMELLALTGILGILSYLGVVGIFLLVMGMFLRKVRRERPFDSSPSATRSGNNGSTSSPYNGSTSSPYKALQAGASASKAVAFLPFVLPWLSLFIGQFVYSENTALAFSFWLFTALTVAGWRKAVAKGKSKKIFSFKDLPEVGLVMSTVLAVLILSVLGMFYLAGRFYAADVYYQKGLNEADFETRMAYFEKAVSMNKYRSNYQSALSQIYAVGAWRQAVKPEEERDVSLLQNYAAGAINQARQATLLSPNLVSPWENSGNIYRDLRGLVGGTLPFSADSFKRALELEPTNPFFYRELCWIGLMDEKSNWDEVLGQCQKAVDLKSNYLDAHIQLALVYERKGDLNQAIERLKGTLERLKGVSFQRGSALAGAATEIYFQMGRLYFNVNNFDQAIRMFEQAVIITPEHANARYALGLSYQIKARPQDALIQFQLVNQLAPGNAEVERKIRELQQ